MDNQISSGVTAYPSSKGYYNFLYPDEPAFKLPVNIVFDPLILIGSGSLQAVLISLEDAKKLELPYRVIWINKE